jgi:hypothetical protein
MSGKLQQKEIFIHEEAMYTFLIGPSLAADCREQPMHEGEGSRVLFRSWKVLGSYSYSLPRDLV